jgi:hypothetical protein
MKNYRVDLELVCGGTRISMNVFYDSERFPSKAVGREGYVELLDSVGAVRGRENLKMEIRRHVEKIIYDHESISRAEEFVKSLEAELNK